MTPLQEFLRTFSDPEVALTTIKEKYGINTYKHPELPLVGFKYNQIDSPKYDPIVRCARGTVLEYGTWKMVAHPMNRFYNYGEDPAGTLCFNWSNFTATEKLDGSLIICYNYKGQWLVNTSGSFGLGFINDSAYTWAQLFWETCKNLQLCNNYTYIFELCSPYNKVVRLYSTPIVRLITAFLNDGVELPWADIPNLAAMINATPVPAYSFDCYGAVEQFLQEKQRADSTFEGVVLRDSQNIRFKCKTETYVALHHLHDNGNLYSISRLVPVALKSEDAEVIAVFPEIKELLTSVKSKLEGIYNEVKVLWFETKDIKDQKEFALRILGHPMCGLLFSIRRTYGALQTESHLRKLWSESEDLILKKYEKTLTL
jgi:hypothetical protein